MKVTNPPPGNIISTDTPGVLQLVAAGSAGSSGEVSDAAHVHGFDLSDFMRLIAEQATEGTTTSTSAVDIASLTGLTVPVVEGLLLVFNWRKTTGATAAVSFGLSVNTTVVSEAQTGQNFLSSSGGSNQADSGTVFCYIGERVALYLGAAARMTGGGPAAAQGNSTFVLQQADLPNAEITSVEIRALTANALVTAAVDQIRLYAMPNT